MVKALLPEGRVEHCASCLHCSAYMSACHNRWQLSHHRCQLLYRPVLQRHCLSAQLQDYKLIVGHAQPVETLHPLDVCVEGSWCIKSRRVCYEEGCATHK